MTRPIVSIALVATLGVASCSSGNGSATPSELTPATKARWDGYCTARRACLTGSTCPPSTCLAPVAEEGPLNEFLDCQNAKDCGANDDACFASAGTTDAERDAFIARCDAALSALPPSPTCSLDPTLCPLVAQPIIRKQVMRAVDACLKLSCPDIETCVNAATEPLNCW